MPIASGTYNAAGRAAKVKLLIVDEDPNFARILATVLGGENHDVAVVDDHRLASTMLARFGPDVLLLSVASRAPQSLALLASFRELPGGRGASVITMVSADDAAVRDACVRSRATHIMVRPFSVLELAERVRGLAVGRGLGGLKQLVAGSLDLDNVSRITRLWARRATGAVQLSDDDGREWVTLVEGGPVEAHGVESLRRALRGGDVDFHARDVGGSGERALLGAMLWAEACAAEGAGTPVARSVVLVPTRLTEAASELPLPADARRMLASLAGPSGFGRAVDHQRLDASVVEACVRPLVTLGMLMVQEALPMPTAHPAGLGQTPVVEDRPVGPLSGIRTAVSQGAGSSTPRQTWSRPPTSLAPPSGAPPPPARSSPPAVAAPSPVRPPPPPAFRGVHSVGAPDPDAVRKRLRRELDLLRNSDGWVVLGVPHDANPTMVQAAGERMRSRYQGIADANTGETQELALAMLRRVTEALAALVAMTAPAAGDIADMPGDDAFRAGLRAMAQGDWAVADRRFVNARDQNLDSARNLAHLGWARAHNNEYPVAARKSEAADLLLLAEQLAPEYAEGQYFLAMLLHEAGDNEGALRRLCRALKAEPDHVGAGGLSRKLRRPVPPPR